MSKVERESTIEDYLVEQAEKHGAEVRKVTWIGRNKAPDRVLMLPERSPDQRPSTGGFVKRGPGRQWRPERTWWVEVKRPGGLATFPKNAHERGQAREHERMRAVGQCVVVVDSKEGVDALFA